MKATTSEQRNRFGMKIQMIEMIVFQSSQSRLRLSESVSAFNSAVPIKQEVTNLTLRCLGVGHGMMSPRDTPASLGLGGFCPSGDDSSGLRAKLVLLF